MGVWHGSTGVFVVYGLVMGAGASINKLWQLLMGKQLGKKRYKAIGESALYSNCARGLLFSFFAIAVTGLWVNMDQLTLLTHRLGIQGLLLAFIGTALCAAILGPLVDFASQMLARHAPRLDRSGLAGLLSRNLLLASEICLIFAVGSFFHKAPEFVYKAF
jgi:hypothetical protein